VTLQNKSRRIIWKEHKSSTISCTCMSGRFAFALSGLLNVNVIGSWSDIKTVGTKYPCLNTTAFICVKLIEKVSLDRPGSTTPTLILFMIIWWNAWSYAVWVCQNWWHGGNGATTAQAVQLPPKRSNYRPNGATTAQTVQLPPKHLIRLSVNTTNKLRRYTNTIFFIAVTALHVSGGFSAHHQELDTVHTAYSICQACLLLPLAVREVWTITKIVWREKCEFGALSARQEYMGMILKAFFGGQFNPNVIRTYQMEICRLMWK
jgi:hypothetical protein